VVAFVEQCMLVLVSVLRVIEK